MECVDGDEEDPGEETDDPRVPIRPELEDELGGGEIGRDGDGVVEPVVPGEGKAVRRGEEPGSVRIERAWGGERVRKWERGHTCDGVLCCHLAEEEEGDVDDGTNDGVADEHAGGAALCERFARAEKEPRADGARDGDHLDLPCGEATLEAGHASTTLQ